MQAFVGPEVSLNHRNLIYAAEPVTPGGMVAGVLLVVFDAEYFLGPHCCQLRLIAGVGWIFMQTFPGNPPQVVLSMGNDGQSAAERIEADLAVPQWRVSPMPRLRVASRSDQLPSVGLATPLLVAVGLLLGGISHRRESCSVAQTGQTMPPRSLIWCATGKRGAADSAVALNLPQLRSVAAAAIASAPGIGAAEAQPAAETASEDGAGPAGR